MAILIVEDHHNDYLYAKTLLIIAGLSYIWANSGAKAIDLCNKNKDINLVLMDIWLPGMDGFETTQKIKLVRKDLPILALTACAMSNDREIALSNGCNDYLSKPYKREELLSLIKKWYKIDKVFSYPIL